MSLEGTIRDLGLHEVGQLLSLSRKSGVLSVSSLLRGRRAWVRFVEGAIVDAGADDAPATGGATATAASGSRAGVEAAVLEVLAWREGQFVFTPEPPSGASASRVRIPTDAMLVESARREDAWQQLADRVPSPDVVPSFVDVEPKALPLLRLVPQEWEVLTRVDGARTLRTLAELLQRDVIDVAEIVHRLVGAGLLTVHGSHRIEPHSRSMSGPPMPVRTVTRPAHQPVAFEGAEPSFFESPTHSDTVVSPDVSDLRKQGDSAARRGDFTAALTHWSAYVRSADHHPDADRVREAIGLAARLHALLNPTSIE